MENALVEMKLMLSCMGSAPLGELQRVQPSGAACPSQSLEVLQLWAMVLVTLAVSKAISPLTEVWLRW